MPSLPLASFASQALLAPHLTKTAPRAHQSPLPHATPVRQLCFARKVCHFAMKGLPLGLQETPSGFWERSTGLDERATEYHAYAIMWPVSSQKRSTVTKVCREKSVLAAKNQKTPRNFAPFLTARVCLRFLITAKLSDNIYITCVRRAIPSAGIAMLCSLCITLK
jgi:hypothetical protein